MDNKPKDKPTQEAGSFVKKLKCASEVHLSGKLKVCMSCKMHLFIVFKFFIQIILPFLCSWWNPVLRCTMTFYNSWLPNCNYPKKNWHLQNGKIYEREIN